VLVGVWLGVVVCVGVLVGVLVVVWLGVIVCVGVLVGVSVMVGVIEGVIVGVIVDVGEGVGEGQVIVEQILSIVVDDNTTATPLPLPIITYLFPLYSTPAS
jgi:hypothetical protein